MLSRHNLFLFIVVVASCAFGGDAPRRPHIDGAWWQVAGDPDLGELSNPKQQPVDFGLWQAADGSWQIWSCIRGTNEKGHTRLFHRWEGAALTDANWTPKGVAMRADPKTGELEGGLQAPFVFRKDDRFTMFYGGWEDICSATSADGKAFERRLNSDGKAVVFGNKSGNTRDPMLLRIGETWHCYYTVNPGNKGGVYCRTSKDLREWSEEKLVARGGKSGDGPYSAECPFVVEVDPGQFYLFRTQFYGKNALTHLYFSRDPLNFGVDDNASFYVSSLPIAAPEIAKVDGQYFIAALLPSLKGIQIARLNFVSANAAANEPPPVPLGLDAYRQWEKWPLQRIGVRAYMRSTYDRRGNNEAADASHFLYQLADDNNVTLDVAGPGMLYFARYNHWHGSPWRYVVDEREHLIQESSTATPEKPVQNSVFIPSEPFPQPLAWTWSATKGADLIWTPIGFERSFRMGYSRTCYGTGYYIYHQWVPGTKFSQPLRAWDGKSAPEQDVLDLLKKSGTDLLPAAGSAEAMRLNLAEESGTIAVPRQGSVALATLAKAPAQVRAIQFSVARAKAIEFGRTKLRITWDGRPEASVDAPVALFFGAGTLYNRDEREFLVKAFPVNIRFDAERVHLACYFPMPFFASARFELIGNGAEEIGDVKWSIKHAPFTDPPTSAGYFHATYKDHGEPVEGQDLVLLDTRGTEGSQDWTGSFVGTSFTFSDRASLGTLEGDPRFFFDDSLTPQAQGTGTEEWGGGGDYWGGRNMTLPFAGHPCGARSEKDAKNDEDKIQSAYRFLLADLMPFGKNALIRLEHGPENQSTERYRTVTYWYGRPGASVKQTDSLKVGDVASEQAHKYVSPQASEPYEIVSRYEWGPDKLKGKEVYPTQTDSGRKTTGSSEFTVKIDPDNAGVMLRRKLDYAFPNQRAEVFVADNLEPKESDWRLAGTWYLAGSNTCVFSRPKEELGATVHTVQTSNRRFRDDEFLLPRDVTSGKRSIRVRVKFTPVSIPLFPGRAVDEVAWSEIRYDVYSFVVPELGK